MDAHPLRPFELAEVFRRSLLAYRRNAPTFLGLAAVLLAPQTVMSHRVAVGVDAGEMPGPLDLIGVYAAAGVGTILLFALVAWAAARDVATARSVRPLEYLAVLRRRWLALLATSVMTGLVVIAGLVLCIVPGIVAVVALYAAIPSVMSESGGPIQAMGRSVELTEGLRWHVFGIVVLLWLADAVLSMPISVSSLFHGPKLWSSVALGVKSVVVAPFQAAVCGVTFERLRNVKEFTDADRLAEVFD